MRLPLKGFEPIISKMKKSRGLGLTGGSSNYPYACARVKSKRALLLPKETYLKLLGMDVKQIARFIGESQYKKDVNELALKYSGIDLVEYALNLNLARVYSQIFGFCKGELKEMVGNYLKRWDLWNIKTVLRGKLYGADREEIMGAVIPAGTHPLHFWNSLASCESIDEVIEELKSTEYYSILKKVRERAQTITSVAEFENALDIAYYVALVENVRPDSKANKMFLDFVRREIDIMNMTTLFMVKFEDVPSQRIVNYLIPEGKEMSQREGKRLAGTEDFQSFLSELKKYSFYDEIKDVIPDIESKGTLNPVMRGLERHLMKQSARFGHLYPLSILPIVDYLVRKKIEIDNIRIIARGKESGLVEDAIKGLLTL